MKKEKAHPTIPKKFTDCLNSLENQSANKIWNESLEKSPVRKVSSIQLRSIERTLIKRGQNASVRMPIKEAVSFLQSHLHEIDRVQELAEAMGYRNSNYFSELIRNYFELRPSVIIDLIKLKRAIHLLSSFPKEKMYTIAREIGKRDEHELYRFIKRRTGFSPSHFRLRQ